MVAVASGPLEVAGLVSQAGRLVVAILVLVMAILVLVVKLVVVVVMVIVMGYGWRGYA